MEFRFLGSDWRLGAEAYAARPIACGAAQSQIRNRNPVIRSRGFSFAEVMFAVVVLGIGFIMIAAIFPAAIKQAQLTTDESYSAAMARAAARYLQEIATDTTMPATGPAAAPHRGLVSRGTAPAAPPAPNPFWQAIRGNVIVTNDPRFAWVAMYKRDGNPADPGTWAGTAQVIIIGVQARNRPIYTLADVAGASPANLQPRPIGFTITDSTTAEPDRIEFTGTATELAALAEGCYVVVGDDGLAGANQGRLNGYVYRIGTRRSDWGPNAFELIPGNDFAPLPDPDGTAGPMTAVPGPIAGTGWIVGRGYANAMTPPTGAGDWEGIAQDISVYTTFVQVK
jgi:Tfp pilus assembly protein PilV